MIYLATKKIGGVSNKDGFCWHFFYDNSKTYLIEEYHNTTIKTNFFVNTTNSHIVTDFYITTKISYKHKLPKIWYYIDEIADLENVLLYHIFDLL